MLYSPYTRIKNVIYLGSDETSDYYFDQDISGIVENNNFKFKVRAFITKKKSNDQENVVESVVRYPPSENTAFSGDINAFGFMLAKEQGLIY